MRSSGPGFFGPRRVGRGESGHRGGFVAPASSSRTEDLDGQWPPPRGRCPLRTAITDFDAFFVCSNPFRKEGVPCRVGISELTRACLRFHGHVREEPLVKYGTAGRRQRTERAQGFGVAAVCAAFEFGSVARTLGSAGARFLFSRVLPASLTTGFCYRPRVCGW